MKKIITAPINILILILLIVGISLYVAESKEQIKETETGVVLGEGAVFENTNKCYDSDNGTSYVNAGSVEFKTFLGLVNNKVFDSCILNTPALKEYYCRDEKPYSIVRSCPTSCSDGKCITCYDSDGLNTFVKGTTVGIFRNRNWEVNTAVDHCFNENTVNEYLCNESGELVQTSFDCKEGCVNGACRACHDSDGGADFKIKGILTVDGSDGTLTDKCQLKREDGSFESANECNGGNCYLEEGYCKAPSSSYSLFPSEFHPCPSGCKEGVCSL